MSQKYLHIFLTDTVQHFTDVNKRLKVIKLTIELQYNYNIHDSGSKIRYLVLYIRMMGGGQQTLPPAKTNKDKQCHYMSFFCLYWVCTCFIISIIYKSVLSFLYLCLNCRGICCVYKLLYLKNPKKI